MLAAMVIATWNVENLFRPGSTDAAPDRAVYDAKLGRRRFGHSRWRGTLE